MASDDDQIRSVSGDSVLDGFLTAEQLGANLNPPKSGRTILRWRERGLIPPGIRLGGTIYYRLETVREWLIRLADEAERRAGRRRHLRVPAHARPARRGKEESADTQ